VVKFGKSCWPHSHPAPRMSQRSCIQTVNIEFAHRATEKIEVS
jgi:hypothetical protein